ncbi:MAG: endo alpha-1,4 polygalactosaminidase [Chloroflexi bacterium]|nr:endo alpha-1,4 polygalactosaminidase [Chloroflexota bacterium]
MPAKWLRRLLVTTLLVLTVPPLAITAQNVGGDRDWSAVDDYIIQLQRARVDRLAPTAYDLVITDIALSGSSRANVERLKHSEGGEKLVVAYMSIGQAATFQYYWQPEWSMTGARPEWADSPDGTWAGDIWVHYWDPRWQAIIIDGDDSYLDRIIDMGFDGVLLDRVDAATYYEEQGRTTAYAEMMAFVQAIAEHAQERSPRFGVFTINGEDIPFRDPASGYLDSVTGILVESLFYGYPRDHDASPPEWTAARQADLARWVEAGKLVLTVDYSRVPEHIVDSFTRGREAGYIPYVSDRGLSRLFVFEGFEPQPKVPKVGTVNL